MTSTITRPALRYHGGKFRIAPWLLQFFPPHSAYAELFGGAAARLLLKEPASAEVYNDLDSRVVAFFRVLREPMKAAELQRRCSLTPYAREELEWSFGEPVDDIDAAHRLVVRSFMGHGSDSATRVSRTGFRSRLTDGRALPSAEWATWPDSIPAMRDRLRRVLIENDRAERIVDRMDAPSTLFYADPPYLHSTRTGKTGRSGNNGYLHEMSDQDHQALLERLHAVSGMVVLSGYPSALYGESLQGWERHQRRVVADCAAFRTEVVWLNPACSAALARSRGGPLFGGRVTVPRRLALISCCGEKLGRIAPARQLYRSVLFRKSVAWAEARGLDWMVMSAKHGLIKPDAQLAPYERSMRSLAPADRTKWARDVARDLDALAGGTEQLQVTLLAGASYAGWIPLVQPWCSVEQPLAGMQIGERLSWLTRTLQPETAAMAA